MSARVKMGINRFLIIIAIVAAAASLAHASQRSYDFCVAVNDSAATVFLDGNACKNPNTVTANDFFLSGLNKTGNTSNPLGFAPTVALVNQIPGLNTLGVGLARFDFAPHGLNPPHTHPHATEILLVLDGTLYVGFVTSDPSNPNMKNKLFTKTLNPGDVFVFPQGLIHFQLNVGNTKAMAIAGVGSQNPGLIAIGNAVFGSEPPISPIFCLKHSMLTRR